MILIRTAPAGTITQLHTDHDQSVKGAWLRNRLGVTSRRMPTVDEAVQDMKYRAIPHRLKLLDAQIARWKQKLTDLRDLRAKIADPAVILRIEDINPTY